MDFLNVSPIDSKARRFWAHLSDGSLQVEASDVGFKPFTPQRETVLPCQGWGLQRDCVSASLTHFDVGFILIHKCGKSHSTSSSISFWENCFVFSCISGVSVGRGEFRTLLHCHIEPEPPAKFLKCVDCSISTQECIVLDFQCSFSKYFTKCLLHRRHSNRKKWARLSPIS